MAAVSINNERSRGFDDEIQLARKRVERHFVASRFEEYNKIRTSISQISKEITGLDDDTAQARIQINLLDSEIREHRTPCNELNRDLADYLGRDEIRFRLKDSGYQITRGEVPAESLSEGEKTAIAFLYFLKSLNDREFDISRSVVVIDDPISSLDASSLYYAFGFLRERTQSAGQLFVMTHNFTFFQLIKCWMHAHKQNQRSSAFYFLKASFTKGVRNSVLVPLDPLLQKYNSEYQYLFGVVYEFAHLQPDDATVFYPIPNIARRFLEAFMAFRQPKYGSHYELSKKIEAVNFDKPKTRRILNFLNNFSHERYVEDATSIDLSILQEAPSVLVNILELVEHEDKRHYDQLCELMTL